MPNITKYESLLRALSMGTYPVLSININGQPVKPGTRINKKDTRAPPSLSAPPVLASSEDKGKYTVISIDIDAPFVSWNLLSPIVHSIQTGLQIDESSGELKSDEDALAPWLPAGRLRGPRRTGIYSFYMLRSRTRVFQKRQRESGGLRGPCRG
ncbi:hypothetical protein BDV10DRAFT_171772 [Aspergillus recurvatus]